MRSHRWRSPRVRCLFFACALFLLFVRGIYSCGALFSLAHIFSYPQPCARVISHAAARFASVCVCHPNARPASIMYSVCVRAHTSTGFTLAQTHTLERVSKTHLMRQRILKHFECERACKDTQTDSTHTHLGRALDTVILITHKRVCF